MDPSNIKPTMDRDSIIKIWSMVYDKDLLRAMTDDELYKLMFQRIYLGRWQDDEEDENDKTSEPTDRRQEERLKMEDTFEYYSSI